MYKPHQLCPAIVIVALVLPGTGVAQAAEPEPHVRLHGNQVFLDAVLFKQMGLDMDSAPSPHAIDAAVRRLTAFYKNSGYTLAEVRYRKAGRTWYVFIDEGRLDRIIILGTGSLTMIKLRQAIHLPGKVFNKTQLENDLAEIKRVHDIPQLDYKVVARENAESDLFQLPDWGALNEFLPQGLQFEPWARYDLLIRVRSSEWGTGFGYGLSYDSAGLLLNGEYTGESLVLEKDRYRENMIVGGDRRSRIDNGSNYFAFSKGALELDYYFPPIVGSWLRPHLLSEGAVTTGQRADLPLEQYWLFREELSLNLGAEFIRHLAVEAGGGIQFNTIFNIEQVPGRPYLVDTSPFHRWFVRGKLEYIFEEPLLRRDLRHAVWAESRYYFGSIHEMGLVTLEYQKILLFGYDSLKLQTSGAYLWGAPAFLDELGITWGPFRSNFSSFFFLHKAAWQSIDYGLSLYHEIVAMHFYGAGAVLGRINRTENIETATGALSTGPGLSLLLYDSLLFSFYYAWGWATTGQQSSDISLSLRKVY